MTRPMLLMAVLSLSACLPPLSPRSATGAPTDDVAVSFDAPSAPGDESTLAVRPDGGADVADDGGVAAHDGPVCAAGLTYCEASRPGASAGCVDLSHDTMNCGACGVPCIAFGGIGSSMAGCFGGHCDCGASGFVPCNGVCVNISYDAGN